MDIPEVPDNYDDRKFEVVVPFKCIESSGGPFNDKSFVAGYQVGALDMGLSRPEVLVTTVLLFEELEEQCDLLAMHHGYMNEVLWRGDGWIHVGFTRIMHEEIPTA